MILDYMLNLKVLVLYGRAHRYCIIALLLYGVMVFFKKYYVEVFIMIIEMKFCFE